MSITTVVLDSGAYAKLFLKEEGRDALLELLAHIGRHRIAVHCPEVFLYEVLSVAARNGVPLKETLDLIRKFEASYLTLAPLTDRQLDLAMQMAEDGHDKAGYPSIYDSAYHALAIAHDGMFITADKRHIAKAIQYGHVALLDNWKQVLQDVD